MYVSIYLSIYVCIHTYDWSCTNIHLSQYFPVIFGAAWLPTPCQLQLVSCPRCRNFGFFLLNKDMASLWSQKLRQGPPQLGPANVSYTYCICIYIYISNIHDSSNIFGGIVCKISDVTSNFEVQLRLWKSNLSCSMISTTMKFTLYWTISNCFTFFSCCCFIRSLETISTLKIREILISIIGLDWYINITSETFLLKPSIRLACWFEFVLKLGWLSFSY
jgi:hypothetical protein